MPTRRQIRLLPTTDENRLCSTGLAIIVHCNAIATAWSIRFTLLGLPAHQRTKSETPHNFESQHTGTRSLASEYSPSTSCLQAAASGCCQQRPTSLSLRSRDSQ